MSSRQAGPPTATLPAAVERAAAALRSCEPLISAWSPTEPVPPTIAPLLPVAVDEARRRLAPADEKTIAVALDRLWRFAEAFGLASRSDDAMIVDATRFYAEALAAVPADLVPLAIDRVCRTHRWGGRPPLPADLANAVAEETARRQLAFRRLELARRLAAQQLAPPSGKPPTPEEVAAVEEAVRQATAALRDAEIPKGPDGRGTLGDDERRGKSPDYAEVVQRVEQETRRFRLVEMSDTEVEAYFAAAAGTRDAAE